MNPTPNIPYPANALYASIRDAFWEVKDHIQAPDALIGGSFLTAISIACQGHVDVQLPSGQTRPTSLNVLTIADSGERKSATDSLVCAPIYAHDQRAWEAHEEAMSDYIADMDIWELTDACLKKNARKAFEAEQDMEPHLEENRSHSRRKPCKPKHNRIIFENTTERPLLEALQGEGTSIALLSDEADIVLKSGAMRSMGMLNKVWSGASSLPVDRMDGIAPITNPRMTVSLMVQEGAFTDFRSKRGGAARDSGHFARYLLSWPDSTQGYRFASLNEPTWHHLRVFHHRVAELLAESPKCRTVLTFSTEAKEHWANTQNQMEPNLREGAPLRSIRDFASKSMEISCRLAALLHHFAQLEGTVISLETLQRAMAFVDWYFRSYYEIFGDHAGAGPEMKHYRLVWNYLKTHYADRWRTHAPKALVKKNGPVRRQDFEDVLQRLVMDGQVRVVHLSSASGKSSAWLHLNMQAFGAPLRLQ